MPYFINFDFLMITAGVDRHVVGSRIKRYCGSSSRQATNSASFVCTRQNHRRLPGRAAAAKTSSALPENLPGNRGLHPRTQNLCSQRKAWAVQSQQLPDHPVRN